MTPSSSAIWHWFSIAMIGVLLLNACDQGRQEDTSPEPTAQTEAPAPEEAEVEVEAEDALAEEETPPPPPEVDTPEEAVDTSARVAILGYHRFSESAKISKRHLPTTIHVEKFRAQMQALKDNEIPVIPMSDFLAWRRGEKHLPPFSVIITIDDGYRSIYEQAFPVLKEFGFPFTLYLYTNYLEGGGKTMTHAEVLEMVAAGAEIGSHSVSHQDMRNRGRRSAEKHAAFLKEETAGSRRILKERLGVEPATFAYPYGAYDDEAMQAVRDAGYEAAFTIRGQKVDWETALFEAGRYIVHGGIDRPFDLAVSSKIPSGAVGATNLLKETITDEATGEEKPLIQVSPAYGSVVKDRRPEMSVDLSGIEGLDPDSLSMEISGVGSVEAVFDPETKVYAYRTQQRLRMPEYWVQVSFKRSGKRQQETVRWKFQLDLVGLYLDLAKAELSTQRADESNEDEDLVAQPSSQESE